jgi:hypothetical protein
MSLLRSVNRRYRDEVASRDDPGVGEAIYEIGYVVSLFDLLPVLTISVTRLRVLGQPLQSGRGLYHMDGG